MSQGWSAAHWADMTRQWVSVALQTENARVALNGAARRRQAVVSCNIRDAAMNGDGIEDHCDDSFTVSHLGSLPSHFSAAAQRAASRTSGGRIRHAAVALEYANAAAAAASASDAVHTAVRRTLEEAVDVEQRAGEQDALNRRQQAAAVVSRYRRTEFVHLFNESGACLKIYHKQRADCVCAHRAVGTWTDGPPGPRSRHLD